MSKSKGNVIDPMEVIDGCNLELLIKKINDSTLPPKEKEKGIKGKKDNFPNGIPECGADSLRFGILNMAHLGKDINLDLTLLTVFRQFCQKIWQSYKFCMDNMKDYKYNPNDIKPELLTLIDRWVLDKLNTATKDINTSFDTYHYDKGTSAFKNFWMETFCAIYIENSKLALVDSVPQEQQNCTKAILFKVMETGMRLLHPMMPFISEELYQKLPNFEGKAATVSTAKYPEYSDDLVYSNIESFDTTLALVSVLRQSMQSITLPGGVKPQVFLTLKEGANINKEEIAQYFSLAKALSKTGDIVWADSSTCPDFC